MSAKNAAPDTPTLVYAYGGFGVPELPHYLGSIGKYWLEEGNAFVLANIRGGGEFGPRWHQAAQGISKHKSVDDLLAVVRDLSERGMSSPKHICLQGGSNGGLITATAFVREPQSIGALVCEVPLTDMIRYPLLSAGSSWTDEYGNPQKYEVCKRWLGELSPITIFQTASIIRLRSLPPASATTESIPPTRSSSTPNCAKPPRNRGSTLPTVAVIPATVRNANPQTNSPASCCF